MKFGSNSIKIIGGRCEDYCQVLTGPLTSYLCYCAGCSILKPQKRWQFVHYKWTHSDLLAINFFIIKPTRCTNFTNLFWHETLHVSDSSSAHHREFIHCTLSNGVCHTGLETAFKQDQDGTAVPSWSCLKAVYKPVWHTPLLSVQWINSQWWT